MDNFFCLFIVNNLVCLLVFLFMFCSGLLSLISAPFIFFLFPQELDDAPSLVVFKKHLNNDRGFNFW